MNLGLKNEKILASINQYLSESDKNRGRVPEDRYTSFDYCYNYFFSFYKEGKIRQLCNDKNLQTSCLQLGFYLASWGMLRASSFLLQKSSRHYRKLIFAISIMKPELWEIDVDEYDADNIDMLLNCKRQISDEVGGKDNDPTDTLITKIMLGVFGNIPAFDQYVRKCFKIYRVNENNLFKIRKFYEENKLTFDDIKIPTLDFMTGKETAIYYPKAKLVDMYGFMNGRY